ncbi:hypothetical protein FN846DRAFT_45648 [Sphaerosporella brunnea]|uniref:Uncharacterized protein n=1 Tax=Sphaerosporella brunnea TaxID=1250544 RepID=A0A5J5EUQ2_9PEZI|nr:hypothetical protein FN846DRAFT_45648 [Sphaerosporella brunnea]
MLQPQPAVTGSTYICTTAIRTRTPYSRHTLRYLNPSSCTILRFPGKRPTYRGGVATRQARGVSLVRFEISHTMHSIKDILDTTADTELSLRAQQTAHRNGRAAEWKKKKKGGNQRQTLLYSPPTHSIEGPLSLAPHACSLQEPSSKDSQGSMGVQKLHAIFLFCFFFFEALFGRQLMFAVRVENNVVLSSIVGLQTSGTQPILLTGGGRHYLLFLAPLTLVIIPFSGSKNVPILRRFS